MKCTRNSSLNHCIITKEDVSSSSIGILLSAYEVVAMLSPKCLLNFILSNTISEVSQISQFFVFPLTISPQSLLGLLSGSTSKMFIFLQSIIINLIRHMNENSWICPEWFNFVAFLRPRVSSNYDTPSRDFLQRFRSHVGTSWDYIAAFTPSCIHPHQESSDEQHCGLRSEYVQTQPSKTSIYGCPWVMTCKTG